MNNRTFAKMYPRCARALGDRKWHVEVTGGSHLSVVVGERRIAILGKTPSDRRADLNGATQIRRQLNGGAR